MTGNEDDREVEVLDLNKIKRQVRIPLICVYDHPTDYPNLYIARVWDGTNPTRIIATAETLNELRAKLPSQMLRLDRYEEDDPCIVEVWI